MTSSGRGRFLTFEGLDGDGKSTNPTQVGEMLRLRVGPMRLVVTREPGGTALGEQIRKWVLEEAMDPDTEALLMFASRREHLARVIEPALAAGRWVLCDRFSDASFAYQGGGRGIAPERLELLERFTHADLQPDLTVLFDIDPETAAARRRTVRDADRFEAEDIEFHGRVRQAYLDRSAASAGRIVVVDARQDSAAVSRAIDDSLQEYFASN
ncbi:dTMP kinase [soil metagenome]